MMETEDECVAAADGLNGADLGGRAIAVRVAEPRPAATGDLDARQGPRRFALARPRARRQRE